MADYFVCEDCRRTTSGRCSRHALFVIPMSDPRAADRAEDAAQLLQRLDQHGTLVSLSAQAASVIRALLTERQSLVERVQALEKVVGNCYISARVQE